LGWRGLNGYIRDTARSEKSGAIWIVAVSVRPDPVTHPNAASVCSTTESGQPGLLTATAANAICIHSGAPKVALPCQKVAPGGQCITSHPHDRFLFQQEADTA